MSKIRGVFVTVVVWLVSIAVVSAQEKGEAIKVLYTDQAGYAHEELQKLRALFQELTGINVNIEYVKYQNQADKISESAAAYDVLTIDQIWLADLVSKGLLAPLDSDITKKMSQDVTPSALKAFQYQKHTWALPVLANVQLFFYNAKMLKAAGLNAPPSSLDALVDQMKTLKQKAIVEYPWTDSWGQAESLICEYVWLTGAFGGEIFDDAGKPIFDQQPGLMALEFMRLLLKEQFAPLAILTKDEIAVKDDFINGRAAFTSNWLFQTGFLDNAATSELEAAMPKPNAAPTPEAAKGAPAGTEITRQGKIGLLPGSGAIKTSSVGAFQGIAITAVSKNKTAAWKWIKFFTSPLVQRAYRVEMPIWTSVQTSLDVNLLDPLMTLKREQLTNAHQRPNIPNYNAVSLILQKYLHLALEGRMEPKDALQQAKTEIETLPAEAPAPKAKEAEKK